MPQYQVTDPKTGKRYIFEGDAPPTDEEIDNHLYPKQSITNMIAGGMSKATQTAKSIYQHPRTQDFLFGTEMAKRAAARGTPIVGMEGVGLLNDVALTPIASMKSMGKIFTRARTMLPTTAPSRAPRIASELDAPIRAARNRIHPTPITRQPPLSDPLEVSIQLGQTDPEIHALRREYGSAEASRRLAKSGGPKLSREEIRKASPLIPEGQLPQRAEAARKNYNFQKGPLPPREDQRGAITWPMLRTLAGAGAGGTWGAGQNPDNPLMGATAGAALGAAAVNPMSVLRGYRDLRTTSFLSGYAPAKSTLGNIGSAVNAIPLTGKVRPLMEMGRLPTNARNFGAAWRARANPANIQGLGRYNFFGRFMGAADTTTQQALERGGLTTAQAQNLLLTEPNTAAKSLGLNNWFGQYLVPFQKTQFNQLKGVENIAGKNPNFRRAPQMALAGLYGLGGMGLGASGVTDPVTLGLISSFAGPFAPSVLLGAGIGAWSPKPVESLTPIPGYTLGEAVIPDPDYAFRWITQPGFTRLFK